MSSSYTPLGSYYDAEMKATRPDLAVMMDYYRDMFNTFQAQGNKAGMAAAHEAGEALRASMGYSGGSDGSQYIPLTSAPSAPSYTPNPSLATSYTPSYSTPSSYTPTYTSYTPPSYSPPAYEPPSYTPPAAPSAPDFGTYYNSSGYAQLEEQAKTLYDAQINQTVDALDQQKRSVGQDADELARQAYIAYLRGQETLPQQLAAMGYNGGLSETRQVELESGWQSKRNQIGLERANALLTLDSAITNAKANGQAALASQLAGLQAQAQGQWNDYVRQLEQNARDDAWKEYSSAYDNYWKQSQMSYDDYWRQTQTANDNYWKQTQLETDNYWKQSQMDSERSKNAQAELARQQELAYQQQRDSVKDSQWNSQYDYQQAKDNATAEWQRLMFEYQKRQDELANTIKQQQLLLQQAEAARKAAGI